MKNLSMLFVIVAILFAACKNNGEEIDQLNADLQGITDTLAFCQSAKTYYSDRIDTLNNLIHQNESRIYEDSIEIADYLSNHKMAVACIAGGYVSANVKTDFTTQYPQIVEDLAGWGIALSILYYVLNKDEVDEVLARSLEADNRKKQHYAEIAAYQQTISEERVHLAEIATLETSCQNRATMLRQQIEALQ